MHKFIKTLFVFLSPVILYLFLGIYIDPIGVFHRGSYQKGIKINENISKLINYINDPKKTVFLGDSKIDHIVTYKIQEEAELELSNLAFGGSNIHEIVETFNFLIEYDKPELIYIGINFHNFNRSYNHNRIKRVKSFIQRPLNYLVSKDLLKNLFYLLKGNFLISETLNSNYNKIEEIDNEKKWDTALEALNAYLDYYVYPSEIEQELLKIKNYCKDNDVNLIFIISPIHTDLIKKVGYYGLENEYERFKNFIFSLGKVYDFSNLNFYTVNKSNFKDPYHLNKNSCLILFDEILNPYSKYIVNKLK